MIVFLLMFSRKVGKLTSKLHYLQIIYQMGTQFHNLFILNFILKTEYKKT